MGSPRRLPLPCLNGSLTDPGRPVWLIDGIQCVDGDNIQVTFESVGPEWRHGLWLAVEGELAALGASSPQFVLWADTAPPVVDVRVVSVADGLLRLYNVWDSGRGLGTESQAATSGMTRENIAGGYRYRCNAIGADPTFDSIVVTVRKLRT